MPPIYDSTKDFSSPSSTRVNDSKINQTTSKTSRFIRWLMRSGTLVFFFGGFAFVLEFLGDEGMVIKASNTMSSSGTSNTLPERRQPRIGVSTSNRDSNVDLGKVTSTKGTSSSTVTDIPDALSVVVYWDESPTADLGDNLAHLALALEFAEEFSSTSEASGSSSQREIALWTTSQSTCFPAINALPYISTNEVRTLQEQQQENAKKVDGLQDMSVLLDLGEETLSDTVALLQTFFASQQQGKRTSTIELLHQHAEQQESPSSSSEFLSSPFVMSEDAIRLVTMKSRAAVDRLIEFLSAVDEEQSGACCPKTPADNENVVFLSSKGITEQNVAGFTAALKPIMETTVKEPWVIVSKHKEDAAILQTYNPSLWSGGELYTEVEWSHLFCYIKQTKHHIVGMASSSLLSLSTLVRNRDDESSRTVLFASTSDASILEKVSSMENHDPRTNGIEYRDWTDESTSVAVNNPTGFAVVDSGPRLGTEENPVTLLVLLSGEMANNLCKLSSGLYYRLYLRDRFGIHAKMQLRHQPHSKWVRARAAVVQCFPNLRSWNFEVGNGPEFDERDAQQKEWLGQTTANALYMREKLSFEDMDEGLQPFLEALNRTSDRPSIPDDANITLPFLGVDIFGIVDQDGFQRYFEEIREFLQFDLDNPQCCNLRAEPDEYVLHFRGFLTEMSKVGKRLGFEELSPNKTANELFAHLVPGLDRIAITSRFAQSPELHKKALEEKGLQVRIVSGQSGTQDFCFLMSAEREYVGMKKSTFAAWAAYLGNATRARLYTMKTPETIARARGEHEDWFRNTTVWAPGLKDRLVLEGYVSEVQAERDIVDRLRNRRHYRERRVLRVRDNR